MLIFYFKTQINQISHQDQESTQIDEDQQLEGSKIILHHIVNMLIVSAGTCHSICSNKIVTSSAPNDTPINPLM